MLSLFQRSTIPRIKGLFVSLILLFAAIIIMPSLASAELATSDEMDNVCHNWLTYIVSQTGNWAGSRNPEIIEVQDIIEDDIMLGRYYAISSGGYIIVPALMELAPVKAYSEEYSLDIYEAGGFALMLREELSSRMVFFAEKYGSIEISQPTSGQTLFDVGGRRKWNKFAVAPEVYAADKTPDLALEGAGPILKTSWHQRSPYNNLCPDGDGDRCLVGCVATAAAQIVWYYQWPPYGAGQHSYLWSGDYSCDSETPEQTLYADFSDPYSYDGSIDAMAELNYEMGVAYEMNYGACASGAWTMQGEWIYPYYFRYLDTTQVNYRDDYTATSWFELIKSEINMRRPALYQIPRHAIVCDGWRVADGIDQYHFNYGWGGSQNAWYTIDNLHCDWDGCENMWEVMLTRIIPDIGLAWLRNDGLSDASTGDGDGVYEAGETVEMFYTVINYGGALLNDVSVSLSIDDQSLVITNGYANMGNVSPLDSVTNTGNPFTFEIPADYIPRTNTFTLALSWEGGLHVDTIVFEQAIGTPTILLVNDDLSDHALGYYITGLNKDRIPSDIWYAADSTPLASNLANYEIVVWFSGAYRSDPLDVGEISAMKGYMDGGGQFFLNGQGIASQLSTLDPDFMYNYLHSSYQMTKTINEVPILNGLDGIICDNSDIFALVSGLGAGNQEFPDLIDSVNGGIAELVYIGQDDFGGVTYTGGYKMIFFSFGFEALINGDYRWTYRDSLLSEILDFFSYQRPAALPEISDIYVSPGDSMHLLDHTPDFDWTYFDPSASPQTQYHIQAGTDQDWSVAELWDYGPISGEDASVTYGGLTLSDGEDYYFRLRVNNGSLWSQWYTCHFHMNSAPSAPVLVSPVSMVGVGSTTPELTIVNSADVELDALTYSFEVYDDLLLTNLVASASGQPEGSGDSTNLQVATALSEDGTYYWRVCGNDAMEDGPWSEAGIFWVNAANQLPNAFELVSPEDEAVLEHSNPMFVWMASSDNDPYDEIDYTLYYSSDSTFASATVVPNIDTTFYIVPSPLAPAAAYHWKVTANDQFGGETVSDRVFSFSFLVSGDANGDGNADVGDAVYLINYIFKGGPAPDPYISGDANCDATVDVGDAVYIINYVFRGGPEPGCM